MMSKSRNSVKLILEMNPISVAQEKWESWANIASWDIFLLRLPDNPSRNRAELAIIECIECMCDLPMYWIYILSYIVLSQKSLNKDDQTIIVSCSMHVVGVWWFGV